MSVSQPVSLCIYFLCLYLLDSLLQVGLLLRHTSFIMHQVSHIKYHSSCICHDIWQILPSHKIFLLQDVFLLILIFRSWYELHMSLCLCVCVSACLSVCVSACLRVCVSALDKISAPDWLRHQFLAVVLVSQLEFACIFRCVSISIRANFTDKQTNKQTDKQTDRHLALYAFV